MSSRCGIRAERVPPPDVPGTYRDTRSECRVGRPDFHPLQMSDSNVTALDVVTVHDVGHPFGRDTFTKEHHHEQHLPG